jgi:hypothetical protein
MPYTIVIVQKPQYLLVKVTGENSLQTVKQYLADVLDACIKNNCPNVLIEEDLQGPRLNTLDVFKVVSEGVRNEARSLRFIAYVDANPKSEMGLIHFAESLAKNQGIPVRVFDSVQEAENWLTSYLSPVERP